MDNALMHGQLQESLHYSIMSAPAVSGAQSYPLQPRMRSEGNWN